MSNNILTEEKAIHQNIVKTSISCEPIQKKSKSPVVIDWYRTPIPPKLLKELHQRSDLKGSFQTLGYLGLLTLTGSAVMYGFGRFPAWALLSIIFLHGTMYSFMINGVHELGHGTVFKTKWLNSFFVHILGFLGWINHEKFNASHTRHHRYTLHQPDDLEVVLPMKIMRINFFKQGFIYPWKLIREVKEKIRVARGKFKGQWEETLFSEDPETARTVMRFSRFILLGHALIIVVSVYFKLWLLPVVTTLAPCYGGWLFFLCNNTQHIGLQDKVPDFRLCCRTFTLNPLVRFLYWQMNYHTEHHMYAAVPCYNLGKLHQAIKHDLPPCTHGLYSTWKQIAEIQSKQKVDPNFQYVAPLPEYQLH